LWATKPTSPEWTRRQRPVLSACNRSGAKETATRNHILSNHVLSTRGPAQMFAGLTGSSARRGGVGRVRRSAAAGCEAAARRKPRRRGETFEPRHGPRATRREIARSRGVRPFACLEQTLNARLVVDRRYDIGKHPPDAELLDFLRDGRVPSMRDRVGHDDLIEGGRFYPPQHVRDFTAALTLGDLGWAPPTGPTPACLSTAGAPAPHRLPQRARHVCT
jgi:hypothetical protein